jgi:hypothetical protein
MVLTLMIARFVLIILLHTVLIHLHLENIWVKERHRTAIIAALTADVVENVLVLPVEDTIALEAVVDLGLVNKSFYYQFTNKYGLSLSLCQEVKFL